MVPCPLLASLVSSQWPRVSPGDFHRLARVAPRHGSGSAQVGPLTPKPDAGLCSQCFSGWVTPLGVTQSRGRAAAPPPGAQGVALYGCDGVRVRRLRRWSDVSTTALGQRRLGGGTIGVARVSGVDQIG